MVHAVHMSVIRSVDSGSRLAAHQERVLGLGFAQLLLGRWLQRSRFCFGL